MAGNCERRPPQSENLFRRRPTLLRGSSGRQLWGFLFYSKPYLARSQMAGNLRLEAGGWRLAASGKPAQDSGKARLAARSGAARGWTLRARGTEAQRRKRGRAHGRKGGGKKVKGEKGARVPLGAPGNLWEPLGASSLPLRSRPGLWGGAPGRDENPTDYGTKPQSCEKLGAAPAKTTKTLSSKATV
jgi:hypothetical protein